jgi:hypothetical protein
MKGQSVSFPHTGGAALIQQCLPWLVSAPIKVPLFFFHTSQWVGRYTIPFPWQPGESMAPLSFLWASVSPLVSAHS